MKLFVFTSSILWIIALIALFYGVYLTGVEHGRLQGLECGTDTECEVLEDMLARHPYKPLGDTMKLSTGKELTFTALDNGAQEIDQELTENEWQEYCALKKQSAQVPTLEHRKIHLQNNTYILDKKRETRIGIRIPRIMRLFVLSSGYVAAFTNSVDETYWGSSIIPLGFGAEVSVQRAVDIMQSANPHNLVTFSGGLKEYQHYISR